MIYLLLFSCVIFWLVFLVQILIHSWPMFPFHTLKTSENPWFSWFFFRRYKVAIMARNGSTLFRLLFHFVSMLSGIQHATIPLDRGRKLNVDNTFRKSSRHLLNVLLTFSLRPLSRGITGYRISECINARCPLKGHTYLNKPVAESYRFV